MRPPADDAYVMALFCIIQEEGFATSRGGSNDNNVHVVIVLCKDIELIDTMRKTERRKCDVDNKFSKRFESLSAKSNFPTNVTDGCWRYFQIGGYVF